MAEQSYVHKKITLKCSIELNESKEQNVLLTTKGDDKDKWSKNITKIVRKVQKLTSETQWMLFINGNIIKQDEAMKLGHILSALPPDPTPIILIITSPSVIKIQYDTHQFDFTVPSSADDWDESIFSNLKTSITNNFGVSAFTLFYCVDEDKYPIDEFDDLKDAFDELEDEMLHIYIKADASSGDTQHTHTTSPTVVDDDDDEKGGKNESIKEMLYDLGTSIASLDNDELQKDVHQELETMTHEIMNTKQDLIESHTASLNRAAQTSAKYAQCIEWFLGIIGYKIDRADNDDYIVSGTPDQLLLKDIASKYYHVAEAMYNPKKDIYQQLNITIPEKEEIVKHDSGINDNQFIIFELPQIVLEKQQTSLVSKTILHPNNLERFINFLKPGASKNSCKDIYFNKLKNVKISPIGLFGSRQQILDMLLKYESISKTLYDILINDNEHKYISSGVHIILPVNYQKTKKKLDKSNLNHMIYLFYWPLPTSFEVTGSGIKVSQQIKKMKKDPSCLLSRVLHEISMTVCIPVNAQELKDFGPMKRNTKRVRNYDLTYKKTKENQLSLVKKATTTHTVKSYEDAYKAHADDMFLINGTNLRGFYQKYHQQSKIQDFTSHVTGTSEEELINELKQLNNKHFINFDEKLGISGIEVLAKAIAQTAYKKYNSNIKAVESTKKKPMFNVESEAKKKLNKLKSKKKKEFFSMCMQNENYKKNHNKIADIGKPIENWNEAQLKSIEEYFSETKTCEATVKLSSYKENLKKGIIETFISDVTNVYNDYTSNKQKLIKKYDQESEKIIKKKVTNMFGLDKVFVSEEDKNALNIKKKEKLANLEKERKEANVNARKDVIKEWEKKFNKQAALFITNVEQSYSPSSPLNIKKITKDLQIEIDKNYNQAKKDLMQNLCKEIEQYQKKNKKNTLPPCTIVTYEYDNSAYFQSKHYYQVVYSVKQKTPPLHNMNFVTIDLENSNDKIKLGKINISRMHYELHENEELIYQHMLNNGDIMMFIKYPGKVYKNQSEDEKKEESTHVNKWFTKVILSQSGELTANDESNVIATWKKHLVELVSYFDEKELFVIVFRNNYDELEVEFAMLLEHNNIQFTAKKSHLVDLMWGKHVKFTAAFFDEIDEDIFVWFIDDASTVRAFNFETNSWDRTKTFDLDQEYEAYLLSPEGSFLICLKHQYKKELTVRDDEKDKEEAKTGRIEMHIWLLREKIKINHKINNKSMTGYDDDSKLENVDHILLPKEFSSENIDLNCIKIQRTEQSIPIELLLCAIDKKNNLIYHLLHVQTSESKLHQRKQQQKTKERKITKLDYLEYMMQKFGSRAAIFHPSNGKLNLNTTYILQDECKNAKKLCNSISKKITDSLFKSEKKDFQHLKWICNLIKAENLKRELMLKLIKNTTICADEFIKNLIIQIPMQIARGAENKFQLMFNGEDDQTEYRKKNQMSKIDLCRAIRFGAYDGLIHAWSGKIKVVTSMGKQSTGKSYKLNHLFGTKFDISGARCTDGVWMTVRIVNDTLYIICDFEGLGSHEREPQEDVLLSTFNAALSSCTLFKCENRFDRDIQDMFIRFQSGVEYLKGSRNCFMGKLLIVIKDVIDNAMDEAANEFEKKIGKLAKQAGKIKKEDSDGKTVEDSGFFVKQMYARGYALITYPPLATKEFFSDLNDVIQPQIEGKKLHFEDEDEYDDSDGDDINEDDEKEQIDFVHTGGKEFLNNHMKMIMAQMNIGDWGAMSSEGASMRINTIESYLENAVSVGAVIKPDKIEIGVCFGVDEDQNLLLLDENRVINTTGEEIIVELKNDAFKKCNIEYEETISAYLNNNTDEKYDTERDSNNINIEQILLQIVNNVEDAGLLLDGKQSLDFFWKQFKISVNRTHENFSSFSKLFQVFLFMIYIRRQLRVNKFITANTNRYKTLKETEIDKLLQSAKTQLTRIRESLTLCKSAHCNDKCLFPCLLRNGHEEPHNCRDENDHQCQEFCEYCGKDENTMCNYKCGHNGKHMCRAGHTCTKTCVLDKYRGCNERCILEIDHDETETCVCNSNEHFCDDQCVVDGCEKHCVYQYTSDITSPKDHVHVCDGKEGCLKTCPVNCFDAFTKKIKKCGKRCASKDHAHQIKMDEKECNDEAHFCGEQHFCPEKCSIKGWCSVDYEKKIIASKKYKGKQYDECAVGNSRKEYCTIKIPENKMQHDDTNHKCEHKKHSCAVEGSRCSLCGYFCTKDNGHPGLHKCQHGNMRNTVFYAAREDKVTMGGIEYSSGDKGIAEHCNLYCETAGRGHIHLEICNVGKNGAHVSGTRHQTKDYYPNKTQHKDEIKHGNFWKRKGWEDPCSNNILKATFNKCPYICTHPTHKQSEEKDNVDDTTKYCALDLWHLPHSNDSEHYFKCYHPFSEAHIIFICDISGSMSANDNNKSVPQESCIVNPDGRSLKNRLGALFESIYTFINVRMDKGCINDKLSAVMTPGKPHRNTKYDAKAAVREKSSRKFVKNFLLKYYPTSYEDYGAAFAEAETLINPKEHTVVIFLTDGYSSDNGAAAIVKRCADKMKNKFKLFCLTLGPNQDKENTTVENIRKQAGKNGKTIKVLSGNELGNAFTSIARHMNGEVGAFM